MTYPLEDLSQVHAKVVQSIEDEDPTLYASLYTDDGSLLLPDGHVVTGRTEIERVFGEWLDSGYVGQVVEVVGFWSDGDIAVEEGRAAGTFRTGGEDTVRRNNYVILHLRGADGVWRMHRDIWTAIGDAPSQGSGY